MAISMRARGTYASLLRRRSRPFAAHAHARAHATLVDMDCDAVERATLGSSIDLQWESTWRAVSDLPDSIASNTTGLLIRRAIVNATDLVLMLLLLSS